MKQIKTIYELFDALSEIVHVISLSKEDGYKKITFHIEEKTFFITLKNNEYFFEKDKDIDDAFDADICESEDPQKIFEVIKKIWVCSKYGLKRIKPMNAKPSKIKYEI